MLASQQSSDGSSENTVKMLQNTLTMSVRPKNADTISNVGTDITQSD